MKGSSEFPVFDLNSSAFQADLNPSQVPEPQTDSDDATGVLEDGEFALMKFK